MTENKILHRKLPEIPKGKTTIDVWVTVNYKEAKNLQFWATLHENGRLSPKGGNQSICLINGLVSWRHEKPN